MCTNILTTKLSKKKSVIFLQSPPYRAGFRMDNNIVKMSSRFLEKKKNPHLFGSVRYLKASVKGGISHTLYNI